MRPVMKTEVPPPQGHSPEDVFGCAPPSGTAAGFLREELAVRDGGPAIHVRSLRTTAAPADRPCGEHKKAPDHRRSGAFEWSQLGSNQRPSACEADALPLSYETGKIRSKGFFDTRRTSTNFNTHHPSATKSPCCHLLRSSPARHRAAERAGPEAPGRAGSSATAPPARDPRMSTFASSVNHNHVVYPSLPGDL